MSREDQLCVGDDLLVCGLILGSGIGQQKYHLNYYVMTDEEVSMARSIVHKEDHFEIKIVGSAALSDSGTK